MRSLLLLLLALPAGLLLALPTGRLLPSASGVCAGLSPGAGLRRAGGMARGACSAGRGADGDGWRRRRR